MRKFLLWMVVSGSTAGAQTLPLTEPQGLSVDVISDAQPAPVFDSANPVATPDLEAAEVFYAVADKHISILLRQGRSSDYQLTLDERKSLLQQMKDLPPAHLRGLVAVEVRPYYSGEDPHAISALQQEGDQSKIVFYVDDIQVRQPPFSHTGHKPYPAAQEFTAQLAHHVYASVLNDRERKDWDAMDPTYPFRESAFVDRYVQWASRSADALSSDSGEDNSLSEVLFIASLFVDDGSTEIRWYDGLSHLQLKPVKHNAEALWIGKTEYRVKS